MTIVISFPPLLLISLNIKPFTFPAGWPFCAVTENWSLRILVIHKIVATKIFMKTVCPGLCLVVQLMHSAECFGIWAHPLASEGPDEDAKPNNGVKGQLMKIYFEIFQDFPYHLVQRESHSCSEEALKNHYLITLRRWGGLFSDKSDKFAFSFPKVAYLHHHGHVSFRHSRFLKI
jgi:hypothetical protein